MTKQELEKLYKATPECVEYKAIITESQQLEQFIGDLEELINEYFFKLQCVTSRKSLARGSSMATPEYKAWKEAQHD